MFVLKSEHEYLWPVEVAVPTDGGMVRQQFKARFRAITMSRLEELTKGRPVAEADSELLRNVLVGWEGVSGEDGQAVPFSYETRDQLIDIPFVRRALGEAFQASLSGRPAKN